MKSNLSKIFIVAAMLLASIPSVAQQLKRSVTWEKIQANPAQLPVLGRIVPVESNLDPASVWSVGSETLDRDYADFEKYKGYMSETGVGYARLQSGWAKTEQKKGKYDFTWIDAHVDGLLEEGIRPWVCLCYDNPLYHQYGLDLSAKSFPDGPAMDGWLKYVKACVKRYKGKVKMWEVWNEPECGKNQLSAQAYANLFVRTAKVIRSVDPDAKIAAFAACNPATGFIRTATEMIVKAGGLKYLDYVTYHAYYPVPELIIPAVKQLKEDMAAFSPSIGLLQGETGAPGQLEHGHAMFQYEWNEYSQAKWDLRQALTHFSMGIPYSFFTMVDLNYGWMLQSFGLIRMNSLKTPVYKRPKFYAVQHITSVFTPDVKAVGGVEAKTAAATEMTSFGIEKNGRKVGCALWLSGRHPLPSLDRRQMDVTVSGLELKEPVYVDMLTGTVHDLGAMVECSADGTFYIKKLPLWDAPVLIMEKSAVNFK